ncbi:hypothetical protein Ddc_13599 [Ditylenchus destructor]|nr:hypothetical protein Ddc_13599 [Ditylenchus destructor]
MNQCNPTHWSLKGKASHQEGVSSILLGGVGNWDGKRTRSPPDTIATPTIATPPRSPPPRSPPGHDRHPPTIATPCDYLAE